MRAVRRCRRTAVPAYAPVSLTDTLALLASLPAPRRLACLAAALDEPDSGVQTAVCRELLSRASAAEVAVVLERFPALLPPVVAGLGDHAGPLLAAARQRLLAGQHPARLAAFVAVAALGDLGSAELLVLGVGDRDPRAQEVACDGLFERLVAFAAARRAGEPSAASGPAASAAWQALETALRQFVAHRRLRCLDVLLALGAAAAPLVGSVVLVQRDAEIAREFAQLLGASLEPALPELLCAMLEDHVAAAAALARRVFAERRDPTFPRLVAQHFARLPAARLAAALGGPSASVWSPVWLAGVPQLGTDDAMRTLGVAAQLPAAQGVPVVVAALSHPESAVQLAALEALRPRRAAVAAPQLARMLADGHLAVGVRRVAAELVVAWALPDRVAALTPLLGAPEPELRQFAVREVGKVSFARYVERFDGMDERTRQIAARALQKIDSRMLDRLGDEIASLDPARRLKALRIVSLLDATEQLRVPLLELLDDPDRRVRATAIRIVELAGSAGAIEVLLGALADPDRRVRANAIEAFEHLDDPRFVQMLLPFLRDRDNRVRANAAKALWNLGCPDAREVLVEMLGDPDEAMRVSAAWAIGEVRLHDARLLLEAREQIERLPKVRARIREALAALDHEVPR